MPPKTRDYLLHGLAGTPVVVASLLRDAAPSVWDRRPDPERFTLREVIAHLADWEGVWLERIERMATEDHPTLQGYDEGQWALDHDYAHADPQEQLNRFAAGRAALVERLRALPPEDWHRTGFHTEWDDVTIGALATLVLGHDGYHTRQIAEWLAA
jgi:hypothetical protein